jgi:hypothetical protein
MEFIREVHKNNNIKLNKTNITQQRRFRVKLEKIFFFFVFTTLLLPFLS